MKGLARAGRSNKRSWVLISFLLRSSPNLRFPDTWGWPGAGLLTLGCSLGSPCETPGFTLAQPWRRGIYVGKADRLGYHLSQARDLGCCFLVRMLVHPWVACQAHTGLSCVCFLLSREVNNQLIILAFPASEDGWGVENTELFEGKHEIQREGQMASSSLPGAC